METADTLSHCIDRVRESDKDRYLAILLAPEELRRPLFILAAFDLEVESIEHRVNEPLAGQVRLQWWRDAIESGGADGAKANPVLNALLEACADYDWPIDRLLTKTDAHIFDLYNDPMPSAEHFEAYAGETKSCLLLLACHALKLPSDKAMADACGHAGVALTYLSCLRSFAYHAGREKLFLPRSLFDEAGVPLEDVFSGEATPAIKIAWRTLVTQARDHHDKARHAIQSLPKAARPIFLQMALVTPYLDQMAKKSFDPYRDVAQLSQVRKQWCLWRAS